MNNLYSAKRIAELVTDRHPGLSSSLERITIAHPLHANAAVELPDLTLYVYVCMVRVARARACMCVIIAFKSSDATAPPCIAYIHARQEIFRKVFFERDVPAQPPCILDPLLQQDSPESATESGATERQTHNFYDYNNVEVTGERS